MSPTARRFAALLARASLALAAGWLGAGCSASASSNQAPPVDPNGPGTASTNAIIGCAHDADCMTGEACTKGICQMRRCSAPSYDSQPPLGKGGYAMLDRELVAATTDPFLYVLSQKSGSLDVDGDGITVPSPLLDLAGGNLLGERPEALAYVMASSNVVTVRTPAGRATTIDLGWQGKRIASGDVDGDGIDELLVTGTGMRYALCDAIKGTCNQGALTIVPDDVAMGDVDGDGYTDLLFIGNHTLTILSPKGDVKGVPAKRTEPVQQTIDTLTVGDLDYRAPEGGVVAPEADRAAEIIGTEKGGFFSLSDHLFVFRLSGQGLTQRAELDVTKGALDVAYARINDKPRIAVLTDTSTVQTFACPSATILPDATAKVPTQLVMGEPPTEMPDHPLTRLAAADTNGNSPSVRLSAGPFLKQGPTVPVAVITLPPYSATHSSGPSSATMGTSQDTGTTTSVGSSSTSSSSVSLSLGVGIGCGAGGGAKGSAASPGLTCILPVSLSAYVQGTWSTSSSTSSSHSKSTGTTLSIGTSYTLTADPQVDGYNAGGVMVAGGCFHQYDYVVEDPAGMLQDSPKILSSFVPVGGDTTVWSARRYGALVDALSDGSLPAVNIAYKLGDVSSYPQSPATLDGEPIPDQDNVFPKPPALRTSDTAIASFSLTTSQSTTNTDAASFSYNSGFSVTAGGNVGIGVVNVSGNVTKGSDAGWGLDSSYSVTVGSSASFSGQVGAVRDDPTTPGNEATIYGYSFQPYVYRHHFTRGDGQKGAYYVLTYAAGN